MGAGCYVNERRDLLVIGNYCENNCFPIHGGCASSKDEALKDTTMCELRPECDDPFLVSMDQIKNAINNAIGKEHSIFLYVPDMFNDLYFNHILAKLPDNPKAKIAINGCVKTFKEKADWEELKRKGIYEVWLGVESGSKKLRKIYNKLPFSNKDIAKITEKGRSIGVNICWFLVDGEEDTQETRLETYTLLREAQPFKFHFSALQVYQI